MIRDELVDGAWYLVNLNDPKLEFNYHLCMFTNGFLYNEYIAINNMISVHTEWARIEPEEIFKDTK